MTVTYLFLDENRLLPEVLQSALAPHGLTLTENDPDTGRYMITGPAAPTEWRLCQNETEPDGIRCQGTLKFAPGDTQAKCDTGAARTAGGCAQRAGGRAAQPGACAIPRRPIDPGGGRR